MVKKTVRDQKRSTSSGATSKNPDFEELSIDRSEIVYSDRGSEATESDQSEQRVFVAEYDLSDDEWQPPNFCEGDPIGEYWPRQSLFHGSVIGVEWNDAGGQYVPDDCQSTANPEDVDIGIGRTQDEALAAMMSRQMQDQSSHITDEHRHDIEEFLVGFSLNLLSEMDNPDGFYQFQQAVHSRTFLPISGGFKYDYITAERGDLQRESANPAIPVANPPFQGEANLEVESRTPLVAKYPSQNYYETKDISLVLTNTLRSTRHGGDGYYQDEDGKPVLKCRVTGYYFDGWRQGGWFGAGQEWLISPNQFSSIPHHGAIPPECFDLLVEMLSIDIQSCMTSATDVIMAYIHLVKGASLTYFQTKYPDAVCDPDILACLIDEHLLRIETFFNTEIYGKGWTYQIFEQHLYPIHAPYMFSGTIPSPVAVTPWRQAWVPLFADYRVRVLLYGDWVLTDTDFVLPPGVEVTEEVQSAELTSFVVEGREVLTLSAGTILANQIDAMLKEEFEMDEYDRSICPNCEKIIDSSTIVAYSSITHLPICPHCGGDVEHDENELGTLTTAQYQNLENLSQAYKSVDLVSVIISGIDETLRKNLPEEALVAGIMELEDLHLIDAFGQVVDLDIKNPASGEEPSISLSLETSDDSRFVLLKPRIPRPARLKFQLLSSTDDGESAHAGTELMTGVSPSSPVCAFLLPDHVEWAMEVFDNVGEACGQLRVAERNWLLGGYQAGSLAWDPAPGSDSGIGELPNSGNEHADKFLNKMYELSLEDGNRPNTASGDPPEGVLSAFMRAIDTTYWEMDPFGKGGDESPSMFMGRPVAVVRAKVCLQIDERDGELMGEALSKAVFEVKLGALSKVTDGLLGYFVNDDYSQFNAVYPTEDGVPIESKMSAIERDCVHEKIEDGLAATPQCESCLNPPLPPLSHSFLTFDPTIELRPNQEVMLTLLMNPQSSIHLTSGFLPQKEITLVREHYRDALNKIAPTFKVGPILIDPASVRMPIPQTQEPVIWSWVFKENYTSWSETPIAQSDSLAGLPKGKTTAFTGWIKLDVDESQ